MRSSRTENPSDRPSRRLQRLPQPEGSSRASAAPGWRGGIGEAAASVSGWDVVHTRSSRVCGECLSGEAPPRQISPQAPLKGGCGAGPSNITRHYAHGPHAAPVIASRGHNAALC
ncbi:MAG: hypothetical protein AB2806_15915 [Candidatus Thiodiazotropha sp.]